MVQLCITYGLVASSIRLGAGGIWEDTLCETQPLWLLCFEMETSLQARQSSCNSSVHSGSGV